MVRSVLQVFRALCRIWRARVLLGLELRSLSITLDGDLTYDLSDFYTDGSGNYLIACHDDLWGLAGLVNGGNSCDGKTFLQVADIEFSHTTN